jgi:hypothetical protein
VSRFKGKKSCADQILKNPKKSQHFVWEPIEGFKLEPRFLMASPSKLKKLKLKKRIMLVEYFLSMWSIQI